MNWGKPSIASNTRVTPQKDRHFVGLFKSKDEDKSAPAQTVTVDAPSSGKVNLVKGQRVTLDKNSDVIEVTNGWTAKRKDYDLKACVLLKDGSQVYVGAANADERLSILDGAVVHGGDVRLPGELEKITIRWHPGIARIAVSSYSALENGTGSFREYGVYVELRNGSQVVGISAADANADGRSYTCCFGEIIFGDDGSFTVVNLEQYSGRNKENRVAYVKGVLTMDAGPEGMTK